MNIRERVNLRQFVPSVIFVFGLLLFHPSIAKADGPPIIDIWYGSEQSFGQVGTPQERVNILGNVTDADGVTSLVYSLNGGAESSLSIGPDNRRLANAGDFNIDILRTDLVNGANQVVITATDTLNNQSVETVTVNYTDANTWPLPYTIDWDTVTNIQDVAQVVDGKWAVGAAGIHPLEPEYDRLIGIGDITWTDYEVEVPITIHGFDLPTGPNSGGPGLGLIMRWEGHTDSPVSCKQPQCGWEPNGQIGWWRWDSSATSAKLGFYQTGVRQNFTPLLETPYIFKMRVESTPGEGGLYQLKAWQASQTEPVGWNLSYQEGASDLGNGSFLLIAHHVDASFGDVTVTPLESITYTLTTANIGNGTVTPVPNQPEYNDGDVVTLTATADPGWFFTDWSGDLTGSTNPANLTMDSNKIVTATFTQTQATSHTLTITTVGSGTVTVEPNQSGPPYEYPFGTVVTLTATPDSGWNFSGWSGDLSGAANPTAVTMTTDKDITASFSVDSDGSETILSDDFNECNLSGFWTHYSGYPSDPVPVLSGTHVLLSVPAGQSHDIWKQGTFASRIMQPISNTTTFTVEAKIDSQVIAQFQTQGILLEAANGDVLRFELYFDGANVRFYGAAIIGGSPDQKHNLNIGVSTPAYMRVIRNGDLWTHSYSFDGVNWIDSTFTQIFTPVQVGVYGGNVGTTSTNAPAHTAIIDYFYNMAAPGVGDVNQNTLTVTTIGDGSVTKNSDPPYACGDVVELTATANSGSSFDSWSGDVVGSTNPVTLTITGSHAVTGTFIDNGSGGSPKGGDIFLPIIMVNGSGTTPPSGTPNLVVDDIIATSSTVQVVIKNVGDGAVPVNFDNEFWVDLYVNPVPPPTGVNQTCQSGGITCDQFAVWGVTQAMLSQLAPQGTITLTVGDANQYFGNTSMSLAPGTVVYAQVDSDNALTNYGAVQESNENDNIASAVSVAGSSDTILSETSSIKELVTPSIHLPPRTLASE